MRVARVVWRSWGSSAVYFVVLQWPWPYDDFLVISDNGDTYGTLTDLYARANEE